MTTGKSHPGGEILSMATAVRLPAAVRSSRFRPATPGMGIDPATPAVDGPLGRGRRANRGTSVERILILSSPASALNIVVVAARIALPAGNVLIAATTVVAPLLATALATVAGAGIPDRVRKHFDELNWRDGIVALDHEFARARTLFGRVILKSRVADMSPDAALPGRGCAAISSGGSSA